MMKKASAAPKCVDLITGYNYPQLISKFTMGAVFYNQACTNYLGDKKLSSASKPNDDHIKKELNTLVKSMFGTKHLAIGAQRLIHLR